MAARVRVHPQEQVVLLGPSSHHAVQVARLEPALEEDAAAEFGVHAVEGQLVLGLELRVELLEEGLQMRVVGCEQVPELELVVFGQQRVHLEGIARADAYIGDRVPKYTTSCGEVSEWMSGLMSLSRAGLSKLRGMGPIIRILGFQPVAMSASRE